MAVRQCKGQTANCKMQDDGREEVRCQMRDAGCKKLDARCKMQNPRCRMSARTLGLLNPGTRPGLELVLGLGPKGDAQ